MKVPQEASVAQPWRKSSFSGDSGDCVDVQDLTDGTRQVRHSRHPDGPVISYTASEWAAFVQGVKDGEFD